ncbi:hypothetical protein GOP47_0023374 [Adiantum capillus-veneris]|uniref:Uncharacterized protein n=1 Tax=Adiantum capillus-veneris TaxID=13818 RepID=A0A9D4U5J6_ADICA|nr:hypothetical protein GOP47_0023374 [Adiantum capillus-veneris]
MASHVGEDLLLLQHVKRSSFQMLASLQAYKACHSSMIPNPSEGLTHIEDGFGTSLVRARPFIEKGNHKKRKNAPKKSDSQVDLESFPLLPRRKRVTLQGIADRQAKDDLCEDQEEEDNP